MKRLNHKILLSVCTSATLLSASGIEIVDGWEVSGNIRAGYVKYTKKESQGFYTAPELSISSPKDSRIGMKVSVASVSDLGINDKDKESGNLAFANGDSFAMLNEIYIKYHDKQHHFSIGREEIYTPMAEHDDYYFIPNSFEVVHYDNSSLENMIFHIGYFHSMAGVWDTGADGSKFESMSEASYVASADKDRAKDSGIYYGGFEYVDAHNNLQIWEYYLDELYNNFYAQYEYSNSTSMFDYTAGVQFLNYKEVGELSKHDDTNIDYSIYGIKLNTTFDFGLDLTIAANIFSDGEGASATLGAFGGYPQYAYGLMFHFFEIDLLDATMIKFNLGYDLSKIGLKNSSIAYRYVSTENGAGLSMSTNGAKAKYAHDSGAYISAAYEMRTLTDENDKYAIRILGGYKF